MTTAACGGRGNKPRHQPGSRQLSELLHDPCQSGAKNAFAPQLLPTFETLHLRAEDLEGGFENMHNLATDVGLEVGRLAMFFLEFLPGLVAVFGVLASTLSLVGSILASQLFLKFLDSIRRLLLESDGDAAVQNELASGLDVEVDPGDGERGFGLGLLVLIARDHQVEVPRPLDQV